MSVAAEDTDVRFEVVYFQRSWIPWVDRLVWSVEDKSEGLSKAGHVSLRAKAVSKRE